MTALESQLDLPPGQPLEVWNDAYQKVESYLGALGVRNKFLLGQLVFRILAKAKTRAVNEAGASPTELAIEETVRLVNEWCYQVLGFNPADTPYRVSTRGRMALLLADMPGKWQDQFLKPGPWPEEFTAAMRESFLRAGPDFQISQMEPRDIDLGAIHTLTTLNRRPYLKMFLIWLLFSAGLILAFRWLHN